MSKRIVLELYCEEALKKGARFVTFDKDGTVCFHSKKPIKTEDFWFSRGEDVATIGSDWSVVNWEDLCIQIAQDKPIWLTKEYEEILLNRGYRFIACDNDGLWYAFEKEPFAEYSVWGCTKGRSCLVFTDFAENPDWKNSLIELGKE